MKPSWRMVCLRLMEAHESIDLLRGHASQTLIEKAEENLREYHSKLRVRMADESREENEAETTLMLHMQEWAEVMRARE